jgi:hypothetical protein
MWSLVAQLIYLGVGVMCSVSNAAVIAARAEGHGPGSCGRAQFRQEEEE